MADNKLKKGYQDDAKIDSKDPAELFYRSKKWKYSVGAILVAINQTRSSTAEVIKTWLDKNWARIRKS